MSSENSTKGKLKFTCKEIRTRTRVEFGSRETSRVGTIENCNDKIKEGRYKVCVMKDDKSWFGTTPPLSFFSNTEECCDYLQKYSTWENESEVTPSLCLPFGSISLVNTNLIESSPCFALFRIDSRHQHPRISFHQGMHKIIENGYVIPRLFRYKPRDFGCLVLSGPKDVNFALVTQNHKLIESPLPGQIECIFNPKDEPKYMTVGPHQSFSVSFQSSNIKGKLFRESFVMVYAMDSTSQ